ncbi:MAG: hypothetical protein J0H62_09695, partial [Rhizobiales bacterium]|nr:hypothetical protein [Hyphomicrobiales bacterium]
NMVGQVQSGVLRDIEISSAKRWQELPDIPTLVESGFPDFVMEGTHVLVAPAGTPKAIVERLGKATVAAVSKSDVTAKLRDAGLEVVGGGPDALKQRIAREVPAFRDLITRIGLQAR